MGATNYFKGKMLDLAFGAVPYTFPSSYYVGLSTSDPGAAGSLAGEPTIGVAGYARVAVARNTTNFPSANPTVNGVTITFPTSTGAWAAGANLTHFFLADAASAGNVLTSAAAATPIRKVDGSGIALTFPPGTLQATA